MMSRSLAFTIVTGIVTTIGAKYSMQTELLDAYGI
jgi:hypothetical protein